AESHWSSIDNGVEEKRNAYGLELAAARALAILVAPVMPDLSRRLWQALGYPEPAGPLPWEEVPEFVPYGQRLRGLAGVAVRAPVPARRAAGPEPVPAGARA